MKVKQLSKLLAKLPQDLEVFFQKIPPIIGTIQEVESVEESTYGFFGQSIPCIILDKYKPKTKKAKKAKKDKK